MNKHEQLSKIQETRALEVIKSKIWETVRVNLMDWYFLSTIFGALNGTGSSLDYFLV